MYNPQMQPMQAVQPIYPNYNSFQPNMVQQPQQQTYIDRYAHNQQNLLPTQMSVANQMQSQGLNGRVVQAVENITANDVPMDGSAAIFPKQDMTEIYIKSWLPNGTIHTTVYKPVLEPQTDKSSIEEEKQKFDLSDASTEAFMKRFDDITDRLDKMEKSFGKTTARKKEADTE